MTPTNKLRLTLLPVALALASFLTPGQVWGADTLVPRGAAWKYWDRGAPPTGWRNTSFAATGWSDGLAELGFGDGGEATLLPAGRITYYFRYTFSVARAYRLLTLELLRDDGAIVYLNGTEVFRSNMPNGTVTDATLASSAIAPADESTFQVKSVSPSLLVTGSNVVAVEIHQASATSSDVSFDLQLTGVSADAVGFAVIGDYGVNVATTEGAVANLVNSWRPDFIITTGDNCYDQVGRPWVGPGDIDDKIGKYYSRYIGNYTGRYPPGSVTNRFFPSLGNHDYDECGGLTRYQSYFTLPSNERYYSFRPLLVGGGQGPVHFFVIDSDGGVRGGPGLPSYLEGQMTWLQAGLAASTAPWKLVYMHHPPFSSGSHRSHADMQWKYKQWGAHAVLAGHDHSYERLSCADPAGSTAAGKLPYFVNGLGGAPETVFGSSPTGCDSPTQRYAADHGAMLVEARADKILFRFVTHTGALIDTFTLRKTAVPPPTTVTVSFEDGVVPTSAYAGTRDTYISQSATGVANGLLGTLRADGDDLPGTGKDLSALIQWDISSIPPGKTIRTAMVTVTVINPSVGPYQVYRLNRPWCETTATWTQACPGQPWQVAGATGVSDTGQTIHGTVGSTPSAGTYSLALNPALVQGWVNGTLPNHGIILRNTGVTDGFEFHSRQGSTPGSRPKLTITYE
jgi:tartrate-resistant acid phosphatase type 5